MDSSRITTGLFQTSTDFAFENTCVRIADLGKLAEDGHTETPLMKQPIGDLIGTYVRIMYSQIEQIKTEVGEAEWQRIGETYRGFVPHVHEFCEKASQDLQRNAKEQADIESEAPQR